ncbi:MAG: hypothetical protein EXS14_10675 [Planctomycetes bacterium]|nr:hypothetical protein [Planctomycetota bacterium]
MSASPQQPSSPTRFDSALEWLATFTDWEQLRSTDSKPARFGLERMQHLMLALGNPERERRALHITGTKGKSSTACYATAILQAHGVSTLRYMSPHVERLNERFNLNGKDICGDDFALLADQLRPHVERTRTMQPELLPTFFEATTAMAFLHALRAECSVLEVGLGGRLDATNVVHPVVTVITSIGLDHTQLLGDTHAKVATEKAGIIKAEIPVLTGLTPADPGFSSIAGRAAALRAPLLHAGKHFQLRNCEPVILADGAPGLRFAGDAAGVTLDNMELQAGSAHQAMNALLAVAAAGLMLSQLSKRLDCDKVRQALRTACLPARAEWFDGVPPILLDGAHTAESVAAVMAVAQRLAAGRPIDALVGLTAERNPGTVFASLGACRNITTTNIPSPRAMPADALAAALHGHSIATPMAALNHARATAADGLLLIVGSLYLAGAVRGALTQTGSHPVS